MMVLGTTVSAQSRGGYFFENSLLRSKLNPAFAPNTNYASFPGVGSLHVETASNVGLKNFVFPEGNVNYLFLNDAVPADQFLSQLPRRDPYLQEQVESDVFGFGMKMGTSKSLHQGIFSRLIHGALLLDHVFRSTKSCNSRFLRRDEHSKIILRS